MSNSFLQSKAWEKFQQSVGHQTFRVDDVLLIKKSLMFNKSYLYIPRAGIRNQESGVMFLNKVKELAKTENCVFLRIEPLEKIQNTKYQILNTSDVQPSQTIILDLSKTEEQILKDMRQKTRYNIRLAEKKGVQISESKNIDEFWALMKETTERDKFRAHSKEYYEKMLQSEIVKLYIAEYEGKILATGIFVFYEDIVTYLHGASTHEHKSVMAPYVLHWEMIKLAKKTGYKYYDFYGIDEKKWPGVTRFKRGFGGEEVSYPGCFDVVFSRRRYLMYKVIRWIRKLI